MWEDKVEKRCAKKKRIEKIGKRKRKRERRDERKERKGSEESGRVLEKGHKEESKWRE